MRMMSKKSGSMVCHRPECRYARNIYKRNRMQLSWQDAEKAPYHRQMPQRTRQQRNYYKAAKHRQEKRTAKRLDALFLMIEKQEGMKKLSVW